MPFWQPGPRLAMAFETIRLRVRPQGVQPSLEFRMDSNVLVFAPARHLIHGFHYRSRSHGVAFLPVKENAPQVFPTRCLLMFSEPHSIALPAPSGAFRKAGCGVFQLNFVVVCVSGSLRNRNTGSPRKSASRSGRGLLRENRQGRAVSRRWFPCDSYRSNPA